MRMITIQEEDEQELCREICFYVEGMSKDCVLQMQECGWLWQ